MLEGVLGNATAEKVLLYLEQYDEGYALGIARAFDDLPVSMVQRRLERLEAAGTRGTGQRSYSSTTGFEPPARAVARKASPPRSDPNLRRLIG